MHTLLKACLFSVSALLAAPAFADITIGQIVPLTGGQVAFGREMSEGAKAYIDKVNAEGGVHGHKIVYVVKDDANLPEQTLARAAELIRQDKVFGILPGPNTDNMKALVTSGLLFQHSVPLLAIRNTITNAPALTNLDEGTTREAGLIEVAPPATYYTPLINEFRESLAKYGKPDAAFSSTGLQGYMAAKVMVNAVRLLSPTPTHAEYYTAMQRLFPDVSNKLVASGAPR
jgi:ABC-type branched-subunit amino acid transport system substrate-binding protein